MATRTLLVTLRLKVRPLLLALVTTLNKNWQVLNLRTDELLMTFKQEVGVTSISFRTDATAVKLPVLASTGGDGRVCLWDLKERRLHHTMAAHDGGISKLQFLPRSGLVRPHVFIVFLRMVLRCD